MSSSGTDPRLAQLGPEARARVDDAMKTAIEQELATARPARGEFSRGIIFSRSRPAALLAGQDSVIQHAASLDDATFAKFADRLRSLKDTVREPGPGGGS
jgi:hypothetical protein